MTSRDPLPYCVAGVQRYVEGRRPLRPHTAGELFRDSSVREFAQQFHTGNFRHGNFQGDSVMNRCGGAFEFVGVVLKVLDQLPAGPLAYLGSKVVPGVL